MADLDSPNGRLRAWNGGREMKQPRVDSCTRLLEMIGIAKNERSRRVYWRQYYRMTRRLNEESPAG
jgi:hypothetical protein